MRTTRVRSARTVWGPRHAYRLELRHPFIAYPARFCGGGIMCVTWG
jgi:hypothetical protein